MTIPRLQVQLEHEVTVVTQGRIVAVADVRSKAPVLLAARPVAILASQQAQQAEAQSEEALLGLPAAGEQQQQQEQGGPEAATSADAAGVWEGALPEGFLEGMVTLWGYGIADPQNMVVCRQGGEQSGICSLMDGAAATARVSAPQVHSRQGGVRHSPLRPLNCCPLQAAAGWP